MKKSTLLIPVLLGFLLTSFAFAAPGSTNSETAKMLAQARKATEKYLDVAEALAEGYVPLSDHVPGMGAHYANMGLLDFTFDLLQPEILLYSLTEGEGPKLVGVEYVTLDSTPPGGSPSDEWHVHPASCHYTDGYEIVEPNPVNCPATSPGGAPLATWHPDLLTLHVWLWRANPDGIFEDFNPNVP